MCILWDEDNDDDSFVLDQHSKFEFDCARSLQQQSTGAHVAAIEHIILILSQSVFALTPQCCMFSIEVANTNFIVFCLKRKLCMNQLLVGENTIVVRYLPYPLHHLILLKTASVA